MATTEANQSFTTRKGTISRHWKSQLCKGAKLMQYPSINQSQSYRHSREPLGSPVSRNIDHAKGESNMADAPNGAESSVEGYIGTQDGERSNEQKEDNEISGEDFIEDWLS